MYISEIFLIYYFHLDLLVGLHYNYFVKLWYGTGYPTKNLYLFIPDRCFKIGVI